MPEIARATALNGRIAALIGGSPSSGLTLLSVLLNAHPDIMCGPGLNLFAHPAFWNGQAAETVVMAARAALSGPGVVPWAPTPTAALEYYLLTPSDLISAAAEIGDARELSSFLLDARAMLDKARMGLETSSPSVFAMDAALGSNSDLKAIVIVRDGRDVLYSLQRRRNPTPLATARWIVKANLARLVRERYGSGRVHVVRYEDIVTNPAATTAQIYAFLGLGGSFGDPAAPRRTPFAPSIYKRGGNAAKSWTFVPTDPISTSGIGRSLGKISRRYIDHLFFCRPVRDGLAAFGFSGSYLTGMELTDHFGYSPEPSLNEKSVLTPADSRVAVSRLSTFYLPLVEDTRQV